MQNIVLMLLEPITKQLFSDINRLRWELERANLPDREVAIANPLTAYGRRFFSQNDEDGILLEITLCSNTNSELKKYRRAGNL